ncbi:MAG: N-acetyl sugar amidotransferase [Bacteroidales bacterium]|jgi:N-acetyl sugar amidotransferase|nr:N-acetyl sugar amidotransferase [Bacteroidales bacterium]
MERKYQVCKNCVMDTTDSNIVFDERGICDHCNTFYSQIKPNWHPDNIGENELGKIVEEIKKSGYKKDFDCILGMNGGIDSSYLLYLAKEKLGLRPLVFHVDAGWNTQLAVNNIERLVDDLKLDLFTEVIDWEEMKDLQLSFFKSGVPQIDVPQDHAFFATMYKFAAKYDIKYILTGGNYSTECVRNPIEWMYYQSDSVQLKDIHEKFGKIPLKKYPITNILWHKIFLPYVRGIKVVCPLNYMPYTKQQAMDVLKEKFGWQPYPQKHFESRFTKFYEGFWLPKRFGYDTRKVQFSSLILTGQMTRDQALEELKHPAYNEEDIKYEFEFIANKLDISVDELWSYFYLPKKSYKDYKSESEIYNIGARVMRMLGLQRGGKR